MSELLKLYQDKENAKEKFDVADNAFLAEACRIINSLFGTQKNLVRNLEIIRFCYDIDPEFKQWLEDHFYKYEGGVIDIEDISSLGTSVLRVLGYEPSYFSEIATRIRIKG